jgi:hypothetical protein
MRAKFNKLNKGNRGKSEERENKGKGRWRAKLDLHGAADWTEEETSVVLNWLYDQADALETDRHEYAKRFRARLLS